MTRWPGSSCRCTFGDSATTCAGSTPTEWRLATWKNAPSSATTITSNLYDVTGQRVEQQVTRDSPHHGAASLPDGRAGLHVVRADGSTAVVVGERVVALSPPP